MNDELSNILKEAEGILNRLEEGQIYPSDYVVKRFEKAASEHPKDQLIGNMREVLTKVASKKEYLNQKEIGKLYDEMYGFSGGHSAFRLVLDDLLPGKKKFAETEHKGSDLRKMAEKKLNPIHSDSELSNAFSVLFSLGGHNSFATFKPGQDRSVQTAVIAKLSGLGYMPEGVDIIEANEHFALCSANYKTPSLKSISTLIPVQITDGVTQQPQHIIVGGEAIELDGRNLYTAMKEAERDLDNNSRKRFASERGNGSPQIEIEKMVVPKSLERFADLENTLVAAASNFNTDKVNAAINMLSNEFSGFGAVSPNIKIASSDATGILFEVHVPTRMGKSVVQVPVEFHNSEPILPSRFASKDSSEKTVYDFSQEGFESFVSSLTNDSKSIKMARLSGPLATMSYQQLMDKMIDGVSSKDYQLAENVLETVENRFGPDQHRIAMDQFSQLLKHSSEGSKRQELIKSAFENGELIKVSTSIELYCPKLGLPVSKVSFDAKGRIVPKGRRTKSENQVQDSLISTSGILFT